MTRRVRQYIPGVAESSPQQREEHLTLAMADIKEAVEGGLEMPDVKSDGTLIPGNLDLQAVPVTFREADADTEVKHEFGRAVRRWWVVDPSEYARFKRGSRTPTSTSIFIQSDTAGVQALVMIFGQPGAQR